jgi:uncharacterized membrane protein YgdD (TMEM256/DUF423 family)
MANSPALVAQRLGAVLGLLGVILGAFAAHALKPLLVANNTSDVWQIAVFYQFVHALALLALGQQSGLRLGIVVCWGIGVTLFCGSLYFLALEPTQHWMGPVTPLGGASLIAGWTWLLFNLCAGKKN